MTERLNRRAAVVAGVVLAAAIAVMSMSAMAPASTTAATSRAVPRLVSLRPCAGQSHVLCGTVVVPPYWTMSGGSGLRVRFQVFQRTDRHAPALEPIVGMEGGPGFSSIASASSYLAMLGALHARHDLIVMDDRGTGSSDPIDCPALQSYVALVRPGRFVAAVDACRAQLRARADAYGTAAVADDLAYVLGRLGLHSVDVYGDSYGSFAAQVFTLRHPDLVRALVLDGAYNNSYDPLEPEAVAALRRSWTALCHRSPTCGTRSILGTIARFARGLQHRPVRGAIRLAPGTPPVAVDLTAPAFAQLVSDASYSSHVFADLPAALRAFARGLRRPLLRLAANDIEFNSSGPASYFSIGDLEAVSCHDYPTAWSPAASPATRRAQLADRLRALRNAFSPFSERVFLSSYVENELVDGCLDWPSAGRGDPVFPAPPRYPDTPTLIVDGEFDFATPLADTMRVVRSWPRASFVEVRNAKHVTIVGDQVRCTSRILAHFLTDLAPGATTCARQMPAISVLPAFPDRLSRTPEAHTIGGHQSASSRRYAWIAAQTAGDAIGSWFGDGTGAGAAAAELYGGTFIVQGDKFASGPIVVHLRGAQLVPGVAVSGWLTWNRARALVSAHLTVRGADGTRGTLRLRWSTGFLTWRRSAQISGVYGGRRVRDELRAPWEPQS